MKQRLLYIPFLIVAIYSLYGMGMAEYHNIRNLNASNRRSEEAQGILSETQIEEDTDSDGHETYETEAVITYEVRDRSYSDHIRLSGKRYNGDTHVVHYNPDDPADYSIYSPGEIKTDIVISGLIGIFNIAIIIILIAKLVGIF